MAQPGPPEQALPILGMIGACLDLLARAEEEASVRFGPVLLRSADMPFDLTDYYEPEMGSGLQRRFLAFGNLFDPANLTEAKLWTNTLEAELARESDGPARPVNLDPGYVTAAKLVLATTKNRGHRIYLSRGIYAEITLAYRDGDWRPLPWTYPDYRTSGYIAFFRQLRDELLKRRGGAADP